MTNEKFGYTYSAEEHAEINAIKQKYIPKQTDDREEAMKRLRRLDSSCEKSASITAISIGIIGTLLFGLGLTFCLEWRNLILGIVLMAIGAVIVAPAKLIHDKMLKHNREKVTPEILQLAEMLDSNNL